MEGNRKEKVNTLEIDLLTKIRCLRCRWISDSNALRLGTPIGTSAIPLRCPECCDTLLFLDYNNRLLLNEQCATVVSRRQFLLSSKPRTVFWADYSEDGFCFLELILLKLNFRIVYLRKRGTAMSIPVDNPITCRRCGWRGAWESLFRDENKGITQALCPSCEQVLATKIGASERRLVPENVTTT